MKRRRRFDDESALSFSLEIDRFLFSDDVCDERRELRRESNENFESNGNFETTKCWNVINKTIFFFFELLNSLDELLDETRLSSTSSLFFLDFISSLLSLSTNSATTSFWSFIDSIFFLFFFFLSTSLFFQDSTQLLSDATFTCRRFFHRYHHSHRLYHSRVRHRHHQTSNDEHASSA